MANISRTAIPEHNLAIFTVEGSACRDEFLQTVMNIPPGESTSNIIWDVSNGTVEQIESRDLQKITRFLKTGHGMRPGGKTALVGPRDLEFGMGRMFQAYAELEKLEVAYKTFRTMEEAIAWIESGDN